MAVWRRGPKGERAGFRRVQKVDISIIFIVAMVSKMSTCVRTDDILQFKSVPFIVDQLGLNKAGKKSNCLNFIISIFKLSLLSPHTKNLFLVAKQMM